VCACCRRAPELLGPSTTFFKELFARTVPPPEERHAAAFFASLLWLSVLTWATIELAQGLSSVLRLPTVISGAVVLSLGAQAPDALASISMAREGRSEGALSNAIGSQVINVQLGIGLPSLVFNAVHRKPVTVEASQRGDDEFVLYCLVVSIGVYIGAATRAWWRPGEELHATLASGANQRRPQIGRGASMILLAAWAAATAAVCAYAFSGQALTTRRHLL
jgi:Ca2+/Na+ antiporter